MKKQRTCAGCRQVFDKNLLIRIVMADDRPVIDKEQKLPGRGVYVCNNDKCISNAIKKKAIGRSLKKDISDEALGRCFNDR